MLRQRFSRAIELFGCALCGHGQKSNSDTDIDVDFVHNKMSQTGCRTIQLCVGVILFLCSVLLKHSP